MEAAVYDLCIVGAGLFGSAAARHASAFVGHKVCLVGPDEPSNAEKKTRTIFGAHYDEGRITHMIATDLTSQMFTKHSIARYKELEELSGIQIYHPVGYLFIGEKNSAHMKKIVQNLNTSNTPFVDLSCYDILEKRYPYLTFKRGSQPLLDDTGAGHISPRNMVAAQKKVAQAQGCELINEVVEEVKPLRDNLHEVITANGTTLFAKRVLICTGAFTNLKKFPIPKLKISTYKETVALLKIPLEEAERISSMPSMSYVRPDDDILAYILPPIQYPDGHYYLKIGHLDYIEGDEIKTLDELKEWYLSDGDPQKIEKLSNLLLDMLPGLKYEAISGAACVTCTSPSGQFYIDRVSPTVTVAVVGNGGGAKLSDEVGRIAAVLSLTGKWDSEVNRSHYKIIPDTEEKDALDP